MKKLYDEIMALRYMNNQSQYDYGHDAALKKSAELAKKYDDEIERLNKLLTVAKEIIGIFNEDDK